jgi:hypothetical protein
MKSKKVVLNIKPKLDAKEKFSDREKDGYHKSDEENKHHLSNQEKDGHLKSDGEHQHNLSSNVQQQSTAAIAVTLKNDITTSSDQPEKKYHARNYKDELNDRFDRAMSLCMVMCTKSENPAELMMKLMIWDENPNLYLAMPFKEQISTINDLYGKKIEYKRANDYKTNFSEDKDGVIRLTLIGELNAYTKSKERAKRRDKIACKVTIYGGPVRQSLLKELLAEFKDPNPAKSLLNIINVWKDKPTKYQKPKENAYFTNYELISYKTGFTQPDAKKLIDEFVGKLEAVHEKLGKVKFKR